MKNEAPPGKMLAVLTGVALISAAVLGYVFTATSGKIEENRLERISQAVFRVLPGITEYEEISRDPQVFRGVRDGVTAGYAVLADGMGFQGSIFLMAGIDAEVETLTGVEVLETVETPGLGDRIRTDEYLGQYRGLKVDGDISVNAVTGATISSEAVEKIVRRAVSYAENIR